MQKQTEMRRMVLDFDKLASLGFGNLVVHANPETKKVFVEWEVPERVPLFSPELIRYLDTELPNGVGDEVGEKLARYFERQVILAALGGQ